MHKTGAAKNWGPYPRLQPR